jgi:hypothetical protein
MTCNYTTVKTSYLMAIHRSSSSSVPFTPCGAQDIHDELPSIAIFSYPLDLIP